MDDGREDAAAERLRAEFMSIPRQLRLALARSPFKRIYSRHLAWQKRLRHWRTVVVNGEVVLLPELLAPEGALDKVLTAVMANVQEEQAREPESEESLSQYAVVLEKLALFQISRFGTPDLRHASFLADKCIAELANKGGGEDSAVILNSMRAFRNWMVGILDVLSKAWKQYRVKIDADRTERERQQRRYWCYSNAPKVDEECLDVNDEEWATLFPIPSWHKAWERRDVWFLSPRLACQAHFCLVYFSDFPDYLLVDSMPEFAKPYCRNSLWMENLRQCGKRLAARLKKGLLPESNCTGEEVFLHMVLNQRRFEDDDFPHQRLNVLPFTLRDSRRAAGRHLMKGFDVVMRFYRYNCNLDTLDSLECLAPAAMHLHPAEWFNAFQSEAFTNHVMISPPERRAEKVEHAIAVLRKARQPLPEETLSKIVSHLDDSDIIRLTCCGTGRAV